MRFRKKLIIALLAIVSSGSSVLAKTQPIEGTWLSANKSHVSISKCAVGHCGRLTKVSVPPEVYKKFKKEIDEVGVQRLPDFFNKDPKLRSRRMKGLQILTLTRQVSPSLYEGEVYNAEDGETYFGKMEVITNDHLRLSGCVFFNLLCQTEDWARIR